MIQKIAVTEDVCRDVAVMAINFRIYFRGEIWEGMNM
jgi:hypothetical protein